MAVSFGLQGFLVPGYESFWFRVFSSGVRGFLVPGYEGHYEGY